MNRHVNAIAGRLSLRTAFGCADWWKLHALVFMMFIAGRLSGVLGGPDRGRKSGTVRRSCLTADPLFGRASLRLMGQSVAALGKSGALKDTPAGSWGIANAIL